MQIGKLPIAPGGEPVQPHTDPSEDRIELMQILKVIWRAKWALVALTLLFAVMFYALVSRGTPLYSARASVMLEPRSVQVLSSQDVLSDLNLNNPLLETEVAVLRSNMLLETVLGRLDPVWVEMLDPANQERSLATRLRHALRDGMARAFGAVAPPPLPPAAVGEAADAEARRSRRLVGALRRSMHVSRDGQSYLISVSFETPHPELSQLLANTVVRTYIDSQIESRSSTVRSATTFLAERVAEMRRAVEAAEARVEDFRSEQIEQSGASLATVENQLLGLSTQLALAQADLAQARARHDQIRNVIETDGFAAAAELLTSPFVLSLREQLSALLRQDADLALRYGPDHPDRLRTRREIELLTEELTEEVGKIVAVMGNEVKVAGIRAQSIDASLSEMENRAAELSRANLVLRQLELEAASVRDNYQDMLDRLNETRSTEQLQRADARQVERAVLPAAPSSPRVTLFTVFGACLGFSIGLVLVYLRAVTSAGFKTTREIERATGLTVSATLLRERWRSHIGMLKSLRRRPYQRFAERLRQFRTAMLLSHGGDDRGQCLVLTSTLGREGKTTTALALAQLEHLAGRSCVVVDFDLRKSSLSRELKYRAETDLQGVLVDGEPVERAIHHVAAYGFDLISLNRPSPTLGDRMSVGRLEAMIAELRAQYDLVVIDTAPVLLVSETQHAVRLASHTLLLVRQGTTRRRAVTEAVRKLEGVGSGDVSVVMTMADPRAEAAAYGSDVYSGYGHGRFG